MSNSLIVKGKYKGNVRDYMTLKQFETYITTGQQPSQTWGDADKKCLAKENKKCKKNYIYINHNNDSNKSNKVRNISNLSV